MHARAVIRNGVIAAINGLVSDVKHEPAWWRRKTLGAQTDKLFAVVVPQTATRESTMSAAGGTVERTLRLLVVVSASRADDDELDRLAAQIEGAVLPYLDETCVEAELAEETSEIEEPGRMHVGDLVMQFVATVETARGNPESIIS